MKSNIIHVLCPEYVPLENKGEEAIIRGTMDVVFKGIQCEYHIVDNNSKKYYFSNGLHVHPGSLFFSDWRSREFGLGLSYDEIYSSICSLIRNFLNKFFPFWIKNPHKEAKNLKKYISGTKKIPDKYLESVNWLKKIDYIIAGHNGGLDEYVCHIINELHTIGIDYGIFGSSMKPNVKQKSLLKIYEKTFLSSKFNIARNPIGYEWAITHFPDDQFELKPDPAFGMIPSNKLSVDNIISEYKLSIFFTKPVIMITTAEPAPIARHAFNTTLGISNKIKAHREFLADFIKLIVNDLDVNILFLPHTIGPDYKMDDRLISQDIINRLGLIKSSQVKLLSADLPANKLKGLIKEADFLIAERLHSIIGAIGVSTPFMSLASDADMRIKGILKMQLNLSSNVYSLSNPDPSEAFLLFSKLYKSRKKTKLILSKLNKKINEDLLQSGEKIKKSFAIK